MKRHQSNRNWTSLHILTTCLFFLYFLIKWNTNTHNQSQSPANNYSQWWITAASCETSSALLEVSRLEDLLGWLLESLPVRLALHSWFYCRNQMCKPSQQTVHACSCFLEWNGKSACKLLTKSLMRLVCFHSFPSLRCFRSRNDRPKRTKTTEHYGH